MNKDRPLINPRYLAYCNAHNMTPEQMKAHDESAYPGGRMGGFMCWLNARWIEWKTRNNVSSNHVLTEADHDNFDEWLKTKVKTL